jgi:hypothetical protein
VPPELTLAINVLTLVIVVWSFLRIRKAQRSMRAAHEANLRVYAQAERELIEHHFQLLDDAARRET